MAEESHPVSPQRFRMGSDHSTHPDHTLPDDCGTIEMRTKKERNIVSTVNSINIGCLPHARDTGHGVWAGGRGGWYQT